MKKADEYDQRQRNMRLANFAEVHRDRPKMAIERIGEIRTIEDVVALLVNCVTIEDIVVDPEEVAALLADPFWRQIVMEWFNLLVGPNFLAWWKSTGGSAGNAGTHMTIFSYVETSWLKLCLFSGDFRNVNIFMAKKPETDLKIDLLLDAVRCTTAGITEYRKLFATSQFDQAQGHWGQ